MEERVIPVLLHITGMVRSCVTQDTQGTQETQDAEDAGTLSD